MKRLLILSGICAIGVALFAFQPQSDAQDTSGDTQARSKPVRVSLLKERIFEDALSVTGTFEATRKVVVASRTSGILQRFLVDEGARVVADKTALFLIDPVRQQEATTMATQQVAIAKASVEERLANQDRIEADYTKAKLDFERYTRLYKNDKAVTRNAYEMQESRYLQAVAMRKHASTLVALAKEQQILAQSQRAIASRDLSDTKVLAPINGIIAHHFHEGEQISWGQPLISIVDPTSLEVQLHLPDEYYSRVTAGSTKLRVTCGTTDLGTVVVTFKSPSVSADLRTFAVKALLKTVPADVTDGRIARITAVFSQSSGLGVPTDAILVRDGKTVIFAATGTTAKMIEVQTGLQQDGWVAVSGTGITAGLSVVTEGQGFLNSDDRLTIQ